MERVFTRHTPGQKVQITDWGVWEGVDAARRLFLGFMNPPDAPEKPITMGRHELTSPYIVVAEDGQTAIGVWDAPGWETSHCLRLGNLLPDQGPDGFYGPRQDLHL